MSLRFAGNAIALVQPSIEPLGRIRHTGLVEYTIDQFFIKNPGILFGSKIPIALAPNPPAISHTMRYLFDRRLPAQGAVPLGYASLAEVFLGEYIRSNLAPLSGYFYIIHLEYHFPARVADYRRPVIISELIEDIRIFFSEAAVELQALRLLFICHDAQIKSLRFFTGCYRLGITKVFFDSDISIKCYAPFAEHCGKIEPNFS